MNFYKSFLFLLFILFGFKGYSQIDNTIVNNKNATPEWFASASFGVQMSGIKSEDFVISNYSPLVNIIGGKWLTPAFALQIGYKGLYFNTISEDKKQFYSFFYGEAVLNVGKLKKKNNFNSKWYLYFHAGAGYFYNYSYNKSNFCINLGIQNNFRLSNKLVAFFDITSIAGWKIYQEDKDILPGISVGLTYLFD